MGQSDPSRQLRCAIYTRKSSEEGLDQDFNSLHAQRDACEAYIRSQAGEGWRPLKTSYDDGGISGGTMNRPALQQLLADIAAGRIDVVVVYKVDRLTRSLTDFAKIVEIFDRHAVSFVSVTQAFNTTSSMGRLTLNVLLSFAQFEREVTGERIRDKVAASKKKGMWMGGNLPLGYDANGRSLAIVEAEAEQVRHIFRRYLELRSVHRLVEELATAGYRSKQRTTKAGVVIGGAVITRGALFHMLANRLYCGQIVHKGVPYVGLHPPIVDPASFDAVQALLAQNRRRHAEPSDGRRQSPLTGVLFDEAGQPMSPTFSYGRDGVRYRYYVSSPLQKGERAKATISIRRLPGEPVESFTRTLATRLASLDPSVEWGAITSLLQRMDVRGKEVLVTFEAKVLRPGEPAEEALAVVTANLEVGERAWIGDNGRVCVISPVRLVFRGGRGQVERPSGSAIPDRPRHDRVMIAALRRGHAVLALAHVSPLQTPEVLVGAKGVDDFYARKLARLAFLAPDLQAAILNGEQPANLVLQNLIADDMPLSWAEQRRRWRFGGFETRGNTGSEVT